MAKINISLNDRNLAKVFLLPSILILLILDFYPILYVMLTSLQDKNLFDPVYSFNFKALGNYLSIIKDKNFWEALKNSAVWTFGATFFELLFGVTFALLLNRNFKFRGIARGFMLVPYIVPAVVSTIIWKFIFNDVVGFANYVLQSLHIIKDPIAFLANPDYVMIIVISVNVWTYTPFVVISMLAALQSVDLTLYDAASVDGASNRQVFINIVLPKILPVLLIVALLRTVWNFQKFDIIWLMTQGGPLTSTTTLPIIIYNELFGRFNAGRASAMAVIVLIILGLVAFLYIKLFESTEERIG